ncbi:hypothetical protein EV284_3476 [Streptomyces sp. BK022]|uniref:hypothetical protein n=1 Tax=Streptomyces sp. BK022 TaxID=2512123 RepID=UPI0010296861|nr:hypothetical protein [Streptomyces sp. BK022]RZU35993.1 hypothetical protein EV284_3476 [Streptomyces sp. BK022]
MNVGNISAIANGFTSRLNRLQFPNNPRPAAQRSTGGQNAPQKTAAPASNPGQATAGPGRARANTSAPAAAPAPAGRSRANTPAPAPSAGTRPRPNAPTPTVTAGDFHFQQAMARSADLLHRTDRTKAKSPEGKSIMRDADRARGRDYGTLVAQDRANVAGARADLNSHFDAVKTEIFRSHVSRTAQPTPTPQPASPAQPSPAPKKVAAAPVQGSQKPSPAPAPAPGRGAAKPKQVPTSPVNSDQQFDQKNYAPAATAAPRPTRKYTPPQPEAPAGGMPAAPAKPKPAQKATPTVKAPAVPERLYSSDYGGTKVKVQVTTPEHTRDDAQTWKEVEKAYPNAESIRVHHAGGTYSLMKMRGNAPEHSSSAIKGREALIPDLPRKERFAKGKPAAPRAEETPEHTRFEAGEGQMAFGDEPAGKPPKKVEGVKMAASKRPQTSKWGGLRQEKPTPPPVQVHPKPKATVPAPVKNPQQFPSSDEFNSMLNDVVNESKAPAAPAEQPAALAKAGVRETRLKIGGKEQVIRTVHNGSTAQLEAKHTRAVKAALAKAHEPEVTAAQRSLDSATAIGANKSTIASRKSELAQAKRKAAGYNHVDPFTTAAKAKPAKVRYTTEVPEHLKPFMGDGPDDPNQSRFYGIGKK